MAYKPSVPFITPMKLLIPTWDKVNGVRTKVYPDDGDLFFGSFRSFGGTETTHNDVYGIENTAVVEMWFRPDLKADCHIYLVESGEEYEILGEPENIEVRNQYMKFKVRRVGGKA